MAQISRPRNLFFVFLSGILLLLFFNLFVTGSGRYTTHRSSTLKETRSLRRHVVIATDFPPHFEVYMVIAWTMSKLLTGRMESVHVYTDSLGFNYPESVRHSGMFNLTAGGSRQGLKAAGTLVKDVASNTLFDDDGDVGGQIDMVILATCEIDMKRWSADLLRIWDARPAGQKFQLVCSVHDGGNIGWVGAYATEWIARDALRLLSISEQFADLKTEPFHSSLFEYVKVDVHYCIAPLPPLPHSKHVFLGKRGLANAAIVGNLQPQRRNYDGTFKDLLRSLIEDAPAWGYLLELSDEGSFQPDLSSDLTPFKLHLIGGGEHPIPKTLKNVVIHHRDLPYPEYYALVQSMDIIMPAFAENGAYFEALASSAIHTAVMTNVPLLATPRLRDAYRYVDDDRVVITRPQGITEIQAILALRTDLTKRVPNPHNSTRLKHDVDEMVKLGWKRPLSEFSEFKMDLWDKNEDVIWKILRDL
ncbi:hypothetical protein FRB98_001284 [Tulasnella sp. 332]|nr:hypothetical protein FRB98_001284 [Tulasnella sp. 332]